MKPRILHVCQPTDGGAAAVVGNLVGVGVAAGMDVTVASPMGGDLSCRTHDVGARHVRLQLSRAPAIGDVRACLALRSLIANADVVHLHSSKAGADGRLAAATLGGRRPPIVFTPHGWSWYVGGYAAGVYRRFEGLVAPLADVTTVVSKTERDDGARVLGNRANLKLVVNGVDTAHFGPVGPRADRSTAPLLVQVGRLCRQKGQERSVRALAGLSDPSARLRLVGDGPDRAALQALAAGLGVADRVEFVGTTDPRPHYRAADLVVLPSRWEGMSLVLLEAMSCGAAIISSDCGGSDALTDCGVVIDHLDTDRCVSELRFAIENLLPAVDARRELGERARNRIVHSYSSNATGLQYLAIWRSLMEGPAT